MLNIKKTRKENRQVQHLLLAATLEEAGSPELIMDTIKITAAILISILLWAKFSNIQEISVAPGVVVPSGNIQSIQHLEGGIISDVLVEEGQTVSAGQLLVTFNPAFALSELERLESRENTLQIELIRLQSFVEGKPLSKEQLVNVVPQDVLKKSIYLQRLIENNFLLYAQQVMARNNEVDTIESRISNLEQELKNIDAQVIDLQNKEKIISQVFDIYSKLEDSKSVSKLSLLDAQQKVSQAHSDLLQILSLRQSTSNSLYQEHQKLNSAKTKYLADALKQITDENSQLLEVQNLKRNAKDRVERLEIRSPVNGIIKGLHASVGSVIPAGAAIFDVVPVDEQLIVEANVSTQDRGHIENGNQVRVKVSTYSFVNYGTLAGTVKSISPSTFLNEKGEPYYKVIVKLDKNYVGSDPEHNKIMPGMTVSADIITGSKSLITYFMKPIYKSFSDSFTER